MNTIEYTFRRDRMIFKVLYQDTADTAPVREHTQCLYVEADSVREVRNKLADRNLNIELIQELNEAHLAYEQKSEHFTIESV